MIQVSIGINKSAQEIEKQANSFFRENKDKIKYIDIKLSIDGNYIYTMIVYELIEEDKNTLKL